MEAEPGKLDKELSVAEGDYAPGLVMRRNRSETHEKVVRLLFFAFLAVSVGCEALNMQALKADKGKPFAPGELIPHQKKDPVLKKLSILSPQQIRRFPVSEIPTVSEEDLFDLSKAQAEAITKAQWAAMTNEQYAAAMKALRSWPEQ